MAARIYLGIMRMVLSVEGVRSLKDRRRAVVSIRDRLRHRFDITFHEVGPGQLRSQAEVVVTTAGNDAVLIRSILGRVRDHVEASRLVWPVSVDVDVFRWHPDGNHSVGDESRGEAW